jgi:hypothetical protein
MDRGHLRTVPGGQALWSEICSHTFSTPVPAVSREPSLTVKKPLRERKLHTPARAQEEKPLSDKNRTKVAGWLESQPTLDG